VDQELIEEFEREQDVLKTLKHPNVVSFLGMTKTEDNRRYLIFEYMSKGSLLDFLQNNRKSLSDKDLIILSIDIAKGMVYIESKNIIHRDLSARNILVSKIDDKYLAKVSDFGMSRQTKKGYYQVTDSTVPIRWTAPEIFEGKRSTSKVDVWSYGVCVWEIYSFGMQPYNLLTNKQVAEQVPHGLRLQKPEKCPDEIFALLMDCWAYEPDNRPYFMDIVKRMKEIKKNLFKRKPTQQNEGIYSRSTLSDSEYQKQPDSLSEHEYMRCPPQVSSDPTTTEKDVN